MITSRCLTQVREKKINGKYLNKLLDPVINKIGKDKVLYIENPITPIYPATKVSTRRIVSLDFLNVMSAVLLLFRFSTPVIKNRSILMAIQTEYGLNIDDVKLIQFADAQCLVYKWLFAKIRPRALLLSDYSAYLPAIKAAKQLSIPVVEYQHGAIGRMHPLYNLDIRVDETYFPDRLVAFGKKEIRTFENAYFIEPQRVHPAGSYYIEYVKRQPKVDKFLLEKQKCYKMSVGVSLAWTTQKHTIDFIRVAAEIDKAILYVLIPRTLNEKHLCGLQFPDNVTISRDKDFYQIMLYTDFHSTVYSSCALEAPSFGVQNVLININGLSRQYYGDVLDDPRTTQYADTPEQYVTMLNEFIRIDRDTVCDLNKEIISMGYDDNTDRFIAQYLGARPV